MNHAVGTRRVRALRSRRPLRGLALALAAAAACVVVPLAIARPAGAQLASNQFQLRQQSPWVGLGGQLSMILHGDNLPNGLSVYLALYDALVTRTAFDQTLAGGNLGSPLNIVHIPWDDLPDAGTGLRQLTVGLQSPGDNDPQKLNARRTGVFPLQVQLRDQSGRTLVGFVTHVVVVQLGADGSFTDGKPLDVAWVLPLDADPAFLPSGAADPNVLAALRPTGRLGRQASALAAHPNVAVTLAPSPETLDSWNTLSREQLELASGITSLLTTRPTRQILSGPYVPLDLGSMLSEGFTDALLAERIAGADTLQRLYGSRLDARTALPGTLDAASVAYLRDRGVDRVVVDDANVTPSTATRTPANPFSLATTVGGTPISITAATPDRGLSRLLEGDDPPALRAAHLLAGLSFVQREDPNVLRGIVLASPAHWDPPAELLEALLAGLETSPTLRSVTLDDYFAQVPDTGSNGRPIVRDLTPAQGAGVPITATQYTDAAHQLSSLRSLVGDADSRVQHGQRTLLVVTSSDWASTDGRTRARSQLSSIGADLGEFLAQIRAATRGTVTITSSRAEIPISLLNETGQRVLVHVKLESDKLLFPDGNEKDVMLDPRTTTVRFAVETRSGGTFPIQFTLTAANGGFVIQQSRVKVRSTFVSGVGIILTVCAIAFLAVWWGNDIRRRRRHNRPRIEPTAHET